MATSPAAESSRQPHLLFDDFQVEGHLGHPNLTDRPETLLGLSVPPPGTTTNANITVAVTDMSGGTPVVGATVAITLSSGVLNGTTSAVTNASGVAVFANLRVPNANSYTLTASSGALQTISGTFTISSSTTPTVASASPSSGYISGGTTVILTGTNFTGLTSVLFGSTPAASFTVDSNTQITAVVPAEAAGSVNISVAGSQGSSVGGGQFTYVSSVTFVVTNTASTGPGSLLAAVQAADMATSPAFITFSPSVFNVPQTITLLGGLTFENPNQPITLAGPTATTLTRAGNTLGSMIQDLTLGGMATTIQNVTITKGLAGVDYGGGVKVVAGNATLFDCVISNSEGASGGGIYVGGGNLLLQGCTVSGNSTHRQLADEDHRHRPRTRRRNRRRDGGQLDRDLIDVAGGSVRLQRESTVAFVAQSRTRVDQRQLGRHAERREPLRRRRSRLRQRRRNDPHENRNQNHGDRPGGSQRSANQATFATGQAGTFTAIATGYPASTFSEMGTLPGGVTFSPQGVLSGTPAAAGTYSFTILAGNGIGSPATQSFTLVVDTPPTITSASTVTFGAGLSSSFAPVAMGSPSPTFALIGALPSGVAFGSSGVFTGSPTMLGTFPVTLFAGNGVGAEATQSFTLVVQDLTPPGTIDSPPPSGAVVSINNVSKLEGSTGGVTPFTFTIRYTGTLTSNIQVDYKTQDGSAVAGQDYASVNSFVVLTPTVTSQTITVMVGADRTVEPDENFFVVLSNPGLSGLSNYTLGTATGTGTILNDD